MPTKAIKKLTSWSFSRWQQYEECPLKAKLKFIDKLPPKTPPNREALDRGTSIHKLAEQYVLHDGKSPHLPTELKLFKQEFLQARKCKDVKVESELAFDRGWNPCDWKDWNRAWVRIKIDLSMKVKKLLKVVDHKTGRLKEEDSSPQLELYALGGLLEYPDVDMVVTDLWFLDQGEIRPLRDDDSTIGVYHRSDISTLKKRWEKRVVPMLNDTKFAPKPGPYCRWCEYSKVKGGPCRF